jgi:hypothetical protein
MSTEDQGDFSSQSGNYRNSCRRYISKLTIDGFIQLVKESFVPQDFSE